MVCIYRINCPNKKFYIGSTKNYDKRIKRHMRDLLMQRHHNSILQHIYNKYGAESIRFEVLEECTIIELFEKETIHILQNEHDPDFINLLISSTWGDTLSNHPRREEIIAQRSISFRKYMNSLSPEERVKAYGRFGIANGSFGKQHTEYTKKLCGHKGKKGAKTRSQQMLGKTFEEIYGENRAIEIKNKLAKSISIIQSGNNNNFFGRRHTDESKHKNRLAHIGRYNGGQNILILIDGIEYPSLSAASKAMNIPITTILYRLKSKTTKFNNYQYKDGQD